MTPSTLEDRTASSSADQQAAAHEDGTNGAKKRKMSISQHQYGHYYKDMNTSMVKSKFLSNPEDLGVVAVGFKGGQVRQILHYTITLYIQTHDTQVPR